MNILLCLITLMFMSFILSGIPHSEISIPASHVSYNYTPTSLLMW